MRKVIFTEAQIKRLVEDGFGGSYLPNINTNDELLGSESEITTTSPIGDDNKISGGPTTDKHWNEMPSSKAQQRYGFNARSTSTISPLREQNSSLRDKKTKINIPDKIVQQLGNGKREDNIRANSSISVNTADKMVHDLKNSDEVGNIILVKNLKDQLKNKRFMDNMEKDMKPENGHIRKHSKDKGGKAHSDKNEFTFTYEY